MWMKTLSWIMAIVIVLHSEIVGSGIGDGQEVKQERHLHAGL